MIESLYLAAASAGFLQECIWLPPDGRPIERRFVSFKAPDVGILNNLGVSTDYAISYPATWLVGLTRHESITVSGIAYQVREVRALGDGTEHNATLTRVSL